MIIRKLSDVTSIIHTGARRFLALNMCAICGGITDMIIRKGLFVRRGEIEKEIGIKVLEPMQQ
jgi:hypothetical protein